jgi:hypothetical protein
LFWKKKKGKADTPYSLEYQEDRRAYYRVQPKPGEPVYLQVQGRRLPVVDLSAAGVAFRASGPKPGQRFTAQLNLPAEPPASLGLEVVKSLEGGATACRIIQVGEEDWERIHQYVLRRQKEDLERRRAERLAETEEEGPPRA